MTTSACSPTSTIPTASAKRSAVKRAGASLPNRRGSFTPGSGRTIRRGCSARKTRLRSNAVDDRGGEEGDSGQWKVESERGARHAVPLLPRLRAVASSRSRDKETADPKLRLG